MIFVFARWEMLVLIEVVPIPRCGDEANIASLPAAFVIVAFLLLGVSASGPVLRVADRR